MLQQQGLDPEFAEGGTELKLSCPLCLDDFKRFYISTSNGTWLCFRRSCNRRGSLLTLLIEVCELNPEEALLAERSIRGESKPLPVVQPTEQVIQPQKVVQLPPGFTLETSPTGPAGGYCRRREIDFDTARKYKIGYCLVGKYHHRVVIPVYTGNTLRTFVARTWVADEKKKVLLPKGSDASRALFNYDYIANTGYLIVVEGAFDCLRLVSMGVKNVVATLGAHLTDHQRRLLRGRGKIVILNDGDQAGREAAIAQARELIAVGCEVRIAKLPDGEDPGSAKEEDVIDAIEFAELADEFVGMEVFNG